MQKIKIVCVCVDMTESMKCWSHCIDIFMQMWSNTSISKFSLLGGAAGYLVKFATCPIHAPCLNFIKFK